ncbi:MAG TPA: hypothetical protein DEV63_01765, partial [Algoriphagus sp.]|nr:hypothetical protein [Algoriphagus sp.]
AKDRRSKEVFAKHFKSHRWCSGFSVQIYCYYQNAPLALQIVRFFKPQRGALIVVSGLIEYQSFGEAI